MNFDGKTVLSALVLFPIVFGATAGCDAPDSAESVAAHRQTESREYPAPEVIERETLLDDFDLEAVTAELEIRGALLEKVGVDALGIGVETEDGHVVLSGEVSDEAAKKLAKQTTLSIDGVRDVDNRLTVAERSEGAETPIARAVETVEGEVADALLETRIKAALVRELGSVGFGIDVEAVEGSVSLRGDVPDEERRDVAVRLVSEMDAVGEVHDLLSVLS